MLQWSCRSLNLKVSQADSVTTSFSKQRKETICWMHNVTVSAPNTECAADGGGVLKYTQEKQLPQNCMYPVTTSHSEQISRHQLLFLHSVTVYKSQIHTSNILNPKVDCHFCKLYLFQKWEKPICINANKSKPLNNNLKSSVTHNWNMSNVMSHFLILQWHFKKGYIYLLTCVAAPQISGAERSRGHTPFNYYCQWSVTHFVFVAHFPN